MLPSSGGREQCALELENLILALHPDSELPVREWSPIKVTPQVLPAVLMAIWSRESKAFAVIAASAGASAPGTEKVSPYTAGCWLLAGW